MAGSVAVPWRLSACRIPAPTDDKHHTTTSDHVSPALIWRQMQVVST